MPLASNAWMAATGVATATNQPDKLDVSDVLAAILLKDTATLGQIKVEGTVHNIEHFWFEDTLNACVFSACFLSQEAPASVGGGVLLMTTSIATNTTAKFARILGAGTILRCEAIPTLFYVNASGSTSATLSIYSSLTASGGAYPTTSNYVDSSGSVALYHRFFVVANPKPDTSTYSDDISMNRTRRRNFTQVFERGIQITETRVGMDMYAIPDELKHQIKLRTYEIKRELNNSVINAGAYALSGAFSPDVETRTMSGIIQQIRDPDLDGTNEDATVTNASGGALTITRINDLCSMMYDLGGFDDQANCCIICGPYQARIIALLEEGRIRKASNELIVGSYANTVKTDLGFELPVVIDRWCPGSNLIIFDKSRARLMTLAGDAWHLTKMAKTGRSDGYQLSGQYTLELRNTDAAFGLILNLAFA